ncbi:hypothetical protein PoB_001290800 [Plakobranchus ocellatus]|uniref:Uncharacterized protein n=1 Tax=Plakobranchus ocellatus TaxID=259542 RepID=A0AAV3YV15_9GAST|nr:hypothetical protein PoB_001290800 [Plakobranchus ocellatus]
MITDRKEADAFTKHFSKVNTSLGIQSRSSLNETTSPGTLAYRWTHDYASGVTSKHGHWCARKDKHPTEAGGSKLGRYIPVPENDLRQLQNRCWNTQTRC